MPGLFYGREVVIHGLNGILAMKKKRWKWKGGSAPRSVDSGVSPATSPVISLGFGVSPAISPVLPPDSWISSPISGFSSAFSPDLRVSLLFSSSSPAISLDSRVSPAKSPATSLISSLSPEPAKERSLGANTVVTGFGKEYETSRSAEISHHHHGGGSSIAEASAGNEKLHSFEWWFDEDRLFNPDDEGWAEKQQC